MKEVALENSGSPISQPFPHTMNTHTFQNDEVRAFCDRMDSTIPSSIVGECSESSQERIVGAEDTVVVGKNKPQNISQELCSKLLETVVLQPSVCIIGSILHPWGKKNRIADHIMVCTYIIVVIQSSHFPFLCHLISLRQHIYRRRWYLDWFTAALRKGIFMLSQR